MISDIKNPIAPHPSNIDDWTYLADVRNISNMYPYGKSYPAAATYSADDDYRYGFNGMEKEKSFDRDGDVADFGARIFDANYPVFLSRDPLESVFSGRSAYNISDNNPIVNIDINGEYPWVANIWLDKYLPNLELFNNQLKNEQDRSITRTKLDKNIKKSIQIKLSNFINIWNDPSKESYSPNISEFLKVEKVFIAVARIEPGENSHTLGNTVMGQNFIYLNESLFSELNGDETSNLENAFIHEMVHRMGYDEFQAYSVAYSAGLMDESDIEKKMLFTESLADILKGSDIDVKEFFIGPDYSVTRIEKDEDGNITKTNFEMYYFREGKRDEFFEIMEETGNEIRGN